MQHHSHDHDHTHDHHEHDHAHLAHRHDHHHHHGHHHHGPNNKKGLTIALIITAGIMLLEFIGGWVTNSLALLSDSGHMLSDVAALALSLIAMWFAAKPPSPNKSYGLYRFEILAALFNGMTLFVIAGVIIWHAYERFLDPPTVASGGMMLIALVGLLANLFSAWALMKQGDVKENYNVRSAYLHVIGDALGSVGAIIAGILMWAFDWYIADPIISVIVALLILKSAWGVVTSTVHILMEGTPLAVNPSHVEEALRKIDGVIDVHDLHIWVITSSMDSLTCHLRIEDHCDEQVILEKAIHIIDELFKIQHTTIQVEKSDFQHVRLHY